MSHIAVVLPPAERFSPEAAGAIALLAHRRRDAGPLPSRIYGAAMALPPFPDADFMPVAPGPWPPWSRGGRYAAALAARMRRDPPALIEVHNRPGLARALAERLPGVPVMLTLHNDPIGMRGCATPAERVALARRLACVAFVSEWLKRRWLDGLGEHGARLAVVPNCLDLSSLPPALPPEAREPVFLFAGRMVADKGADLFIEACAEVLPRLPSWRAAMIGGDRFGPEARETPFLRRWRPAAERAGIEALGYRPHGEVMRAMARAAIVVVPSRWPEPFGLTALEAMANGAALIATARGGLPEVVGEGGVLVEGESLAVAMRALACDLPKRVRLVTKAQARAKVYDISISRNHVGNVRVGMMKPT